MFAPLGWVVVACAVLTTVGCGEKHDPRLAQLEDLPVAEEYVDVAIGKFHIPVPITLDGRPEVGPPRNSVEVEFSLYATVRPEDENETKEMVERKAGQIRDRVITVFRHATVEDLNDQTMVAIKSHLLDATLPLFEGLPVQSYTLADRQTKPL